MLDYLVFMVPPMLLALWAQFKVKSAYSAASKLPALSGISGAEAAQKILDSFGIRGVGIEEVQGHLSDHYDPKSKVLRLSSEVFRGRSLASLGIAAHEVGHAIQDHQKYYPLVVRNGIVPLAIWGDKAFLILFMAGLMFKMTGLILLAIGFFSLTVIFQLINLPVEFDASNRAKAILVQRGIVSSQEVKIVDNVLSAAALTYVAATIGAMMQLIYYLWQMGLLGGSREE